jgi:hypothetical protein
VWYLVRKRIARIFRRKGKKDDCLSNESTSDNESQDDEAYSSDDFDINDCANDKSKTDDMINKLLPCPLQQRTRRWI